MKAMKVVLSLPRIPIIQLVRVSLCVMDSCIGGNLSHFMMIIGIGIGIGIDLVVGRNDDGRVDLVLI